MVEREQKERTLQFAAISNHADSPGLEQMYRDHYKRVLYAAYRVTGNMDDAEDVLQTVFMRLARREGGSPLSDSPGNYLHRAAINAAVDIVRSRKAARSTPLDDVDHTLSGDEDDSPQQDQANREMQDLVRQALTKVSPKAAEIFVLRYFEGYGNNEIAKMLGTSRSTVNVILHRTRNRLKDDLGSVLGDRS